MNNELLTTDKWQLYSTFVEYSLQFNLFMQNEPNFQKVKMNINKVLSRGYEKKTLGERRKNEPKTNPIRTQTNPISKGVSTREPDVAQLLAHGTFSANIQHSERL